MNKVLIILSLVLLASCSPKEVTSGQLVERQGIKYEVNSTTPFAGIVLDYHDNGQLKEKVNYKDGEKDGLEERYQENGELLMKDNYKKGKLQWGDAKEVVDREGISYEVNSTTPFTGPAVSYHDNGQLAGRFNLTDGKQIDGFMEAYHDNGQVALRGNYRGEKRHGLVEFFHRNGQIMFKQNYKDGNNVDGLFNMYLENGELSSSSCIDNGESVDMSYCE